MKKIFSKVGLLFFILGVVYGGDEKGIILYMFLTLTILGATLYVNFGNE